MIKLTINKYYKIKNFNNPLKFIGIYEGDYICDLCNKNHYNKTLPRLYWFAVDKDNHAKYGSICINKVIMQ